LVANLFPNALSAFAGGLAPGAQLLAPDTPLFPLRGAKFPRPLSGF
jgi:hypothetical protein